MRKEPLQEGRGSRVGNLEIVIHDVGHGQAIHAFTPNGKTIVIDLGASGTFSPLTWLRRKTRVIDNLIVTHPHGDHIEEMGLVDGFTVSTFTRPRGLTRSEVYDANQASYSTQIEKYLEMDQQYNSPVDPRNLLVPTNTGGVDVRTWGSFACGRSNINNHSLVISFHHASSTVVIPGDNEPPSWRALLEEAHFRRMLTGTDVFMASHHARESGYCSDIFARDLCRPKICVVSDGRSGHTDARERYTNHATGWPVHSRSQQAAEERSCLTTRRDGRVAILAGRSAGAGGPGRPFLQVTID